MLRKGKKSKFKRILKKILSPKYFIILILLLVGNSLAWFIYAKEVSNNVTVHVRAWKILFENGDSPIVDIVNFNVNNMYPGMTEYTESLTAYNQGEVAANLTYTVMKVNIMGEETKTKEGKEADGDVLDGTELTSDQMITKLANDYPFKINLNLSTTSIDAQYGEATYGIKVNWAYESGNDTADTYWGTRAYDFIQVNPDTPCITITVKVAITQRQ